MPNDSASVSPNDRCDSVSMAEGDGIWCEFGARIFAHSLRLGIA